MWVADFWKTSVQLFDRRGTSGGEGNQTSKERRNFGTQSKKHTPSPQDRQFVGT